MALPSVAFACPLPPPPVKDLSLSRFYEDDAGSVVNDELLAKHKAATAPVRDFLSAVVKEADASLRQLSPSLGAYRSQCALDWLDTWARGGALTGTMASKQAEAERRWTLASAALAYLKVKSHATPEQRTAIGAWLKALSQKSLAVFNDTGVKRNNHWYWMGLGAGATGLATGDKALWSTARGILANAANDVSADGTLPHELAREGRALHYHAFALMPVMALAELSAAKGDAPVASERAALERLASVTLKGLRDPGEFDVLAGSGQEQPVKPGAGWLFLARANGFPGLAGEEIEMATGHRWLGGNVALLRKALGTDRSGDVPKPVSN